jgi:hypothetical protein
MPIMGEVSLEEIIKLAKKTEKPVFYYVVNARGNLVRNEMHSDGLFTRTTGNDNTSITTKHLPTTNFPRFFNYWHAYAHQLKIKSERKESGT